jgi:lysophospholipase L1-like esterase
MYVLIEIPGNDLHQYCPLHRDLTHTNDQNGKEIISWVPNRKPTHAQTRRWPVDLILEVPINRVTCSKVYVFTETGCPEKVIDPIYDQR